MINKIIPKKHLVVLVFLGVLGRTFLSVERHYLDNLDKVVRAFLPFEKQTARNSSPD